MTMSTSRRRLALFVSLLALGGALAACGGDDSEDATATPDGETPTSTAGMQNPIEALPEDARLFVYAAGARPFNGDAAQFLAVLAFDPVLPEVVPGDRELVSATIAPSPRGRGKNDEAATLILEYRGTSEQDSIQLTEQKVPMADLSALDLETVDVGETEAIVMPFEGSDAIQVQWHACDITFAISSSVIDATEAGEMGSSMHPECEGTPRATPTEAAAGD